MNRHLTYLYSTVQICSLMEKDNGSKQLTLNHLDGKAEPKEFKGLFSNGKEKEGEKKENLTKTCSLEAYVAAY